MKLIDKLKWILGILIVFVLIATTNLIDRSNFVQVRDSVESIYRDRLIAKDLILDMYKAVQEKEIALITSDTRFFEGRNNILNEELKQLLNSFEQTRLTENEEQVFSRLKEKFQELTSLEAKAVSDDFSQVKESLQLVRKLEGDLYALSDIQISEGSRQLSITKRATDSIEFFTQLEIGILILLAIMIQIIILYRPSKN